MSVPKIVIKDRTFSEKWYEVVTFQGGALKIGGFVFILVLVSAIIYFGFFDNFKNTEKKGKLLPISIILFLFFVAALSALFAAAGP